MERGGTLLLNPGSQSTTDIVVAKNKHTDNITYANSTVDHV